MSNLVVPSSRPRPRTLDPEERLFRHSARPKWGVGVWVREERSRRRLRFEDGELRAFKEGFYHLLVPVDSDKVDVDEVFERVMGEHLEEAELPKHATPPVMGFDAQLAVFLGLFPGVFSGGTFQAMYGADSNGKRSVDVAIREMKAVAAGLSPQETFDTVMDVWTRTALVTPQKVKACRGLSVDDQQVLGAAMGNLLHGDARFAKRFAAWLDATRHTSASFGWRTATAILALAKPKKHVLVRRRVVQLQAAIVRPTRVPSEPSLAGYRRARRVMRTTYDKLTRAGLAPRSLLDVYVFIWETLRPKGQELARSL